MNKKLKFQIDDKIYYHSVACARYLAKKFDLAGNNHRESLEIDNIVENIIEIRESKYRLIFLFYFYFSTSCFENRKTKI